MEEKTSGAGPRRRDGADPESSSSSSSRRGGGGGGDGGPTGKKSRYAVDDINIDQGGGDPMECSGKHCRSCTAGLIADCVALCCCPCAVWNILGLAFVKVPLMVGRKCLGRGKKRRKRKCKKRESDDDDGVVGERECNLERNVVTELGISEFEFCGFVDGGGGGEEEEKGRLSAKSEAERVWMELYQVGHLGFGRVSISG